MKYNCNTTVILLERDDWQVGIKVANTATLIVVNDHMSYHITHHEEEGGSHLMK